MATRNARALICALTAVWLTGCDEMAAPPPQQVPPFVVSESGAGFSPQTDGVLVRFEEGTRSDGAVRISADGLRVYAETGERVGRLRRSADGFVLELRDGSDVCDVVLSAPDATLTCGQRVWRMTPGAAPDRLVLSLPDGTRIEVVGSRDLAQAELPDGTRVVVERQGTELSIASGAWQRRAADLRGRLDARAVAVREVARHGASAVEGVPDVLIASALLWMNQRLHPAEPGTAAVQNVPPSSPTTGSGSSATAAEGSVSAAGL